MTQLALLFGLTAGLYASVGFGGGSTYNALLVLAETDYRLLPSVALICNIIVVIGGTIRFAKGGHIPWRRVWPLFALSVPAAWLGGRINVSETVFIFILGGALLVAGLNMLFVSPPASADRPRRLPLWSEPGLGGGLGLISGLVGIGGGIFLAPILHIARWGGAKAIAGTCSAFILANSLAGLAGQFTKLSESGRTADLAAYWPLMLAVFIGGQIGSLLATTTLPDRVIRLATAGLILFVALRLLWGLL
ncbi:MAG: sulfite exporter TauE/SafE family protein [Pacificimonas sp.]